MLIKEEYHLVVKQIGRVDEVFGGVHIGKNRPPSKQPLLPVQLNPDLD